MRKLVFWMPLLFVGSMMYWTVAVGLGGLSLAALLPAVEGAERDMYQPIRVTFGKGTDTACPTDPADTLGNEPAQTSEAVEGDEPEADEGGSERSAADAVPPPPVAGPPQGPGDTAF
jgi:hypothetical protein